MKALVGSWDRRPHMLLAELTALRTRIGELQSELDDLRTENAMLKELREVADRAEEALAASSA